MNILKDRYINDVRKEYLSNKTNDIVRRALTNAKMSDVASNNNTYTSDFSINIETMSVCNQKQSGRCWAFAGLNLLREKIAKELDIESFELSQNYLTFYDKLEKCNYFLECIIETRTKKLDDRLVTKILKDGISDGGYFKYFTNIIEKYGIVPSYAYPETYQSSNTREINLVLNSYMRQVASNIRNTTNLKQIDKIKEDAMRKVYTILCSCYGVPPVEFDFEYTTKESKEYHIDTSLTPLKFYKKYININFDDYVDITNVPSKEYGKCYYLDYHKNVYEKDYEKLYNVKMDYLKELIIKQLSDKEPVWFGCDVLQMLNRETGLLDDTNYNVSQLFGLNLNYNKEVCLEYRDVECNHAMMLSGVNIVNGKPNKWKIENSWGDKVGKKGYFTCTDTWFDKYVFEAVINKKYLSKEDLNNISKKPTKLEPWDSME
jgi:bleomycin hydrolase